MGTSHKSKDGTGFGSINDDHGDVCTGVNSGGDFKVARGFLIRRGGSGPDCKRPLCICNEW